ESALGDFKGLDNTLSVIVAKGLKVSNVSSAANPLHDMIALWPNDHSPTHLIVAVETSRNAVDGSNASVQIIDLQGNPNSNARTILEGLTGADPIKRTPWGTIVVGEEAGDGGLYEIFDPLGIGTAIRVTNRATGATTEGSPTHVFKRKAVGALAFEGIAITVDGTMYYGDELRPDLGNAGGAIYKYVPAAPYAGSGSVTSATSPLAWGQSTGCGWGPTLPITLPIAIMAREPKLE